MGREEGEGERRGKGRRGKGRGGKRRAPMTLWHGAPNVLIRPWLQLGQLDQKFQVEGVAPTTNHSSSQKTRLKDLSYGIKIWTFFRFVTIHYPRVGQTDRQTEHLPRSYSLLVFHAARKKTAAEARYFYSASVLLAIQCAVIARETGLLVTFRCFVQTSQLKIR